MIQRQKTTRIIKDGQQVGETTTTDALLPLEIYIHPQWGPDGIQGATITFRTDEGSVQVQMSDLPEATAQEGYKFFADAFESAYISSKE